MKITRQLLAGVLGLLVIVAIPVVTGFGSHVFGAPGNPPSSLKPNPKLEAAANAKRIAQPIASRWPLRTAEDALKGLAHDDFAQSLIAGLRSGGPERDERVTTPVVIGAPVLARALVPGGRDEFLVPVFAGTQPVGIFKISLNADGLGAVGMYRRWAYPTFPAIPQAQALTLGSDPSDVATGAELVWALVSPQADGAFADETAPFWRITRSSGVVVYLFESGTVLPAADIHPKGR